MTPEEYTRISQLLRTLAPKYHIPRQALEDAIQEACLLSLEGEATDHPAADETLIRGAKRAYGHPERQPYQLLPPPDPTTLDPPPDSWMVDDLRDALAQSIQEAAGALGLDYGTGLLAYLQGSRDRAVVGNLLDKHHNHQPRIWKSRKRWLDLATYRAFVRRLGLVRGRLDVSDLQRGE